MAKTRQVDLQKIDQMTKELDDEINRLLEDYVESQLLELEQKESKNIDSLLGNLIKEEKTTPEVSREITRISRDIFNSDFIQNHSQKYFLRNLSKKQSDNLSKLINFTLEQIERGMGSEDDEKKAQDRIDVEMKKLEKFCNSDYLAQRESSKRALSESLLEEQTISSQIKNLKEDLEIVRSIEKLNQQIEKILKLDEEIGRLQIVPKDEAEDKQKERVGELEKLQSQKAGFPSIEKLTRERLAKEETFKKRQRNRLDIQTMDGDAIQKLIFLRQGELKETERNIKAIEETLGEKKEEIERRITKLHQDKTKIITAKQTFKALSKRKEWWQITKPDSEKGLIQRLASAVKNKSNPEEALKLFAEFNEEWFKLRIRDEEPSPCADPLLRPFLQHAPRLPNDLTKVNKIQKNISSIVEEQLHNKAKIKHLGNQINKADKEFKGDETKKYDVLYETVFGKKIKDKTQKKRIRQALKNFLLESESSAPRSFESHCREQHVNLKVLANIAELNFKATLKRGRSSVFGRSGLLTTTGQSMSKLAELGQSTRSIQGKSTRQLHSVAAAGAGAGSEVVSSRPSFSRPKSITTVAPAPSPMNLPGGAPSPATPVATPQEGQNAAPAAVAPGPEIVLRVPETPITTKDRSKRASQKGAAVYAIQDEEAGNPNSLEDPNATFRTAADPSFMRIVDEDTLPEITEESPDVRQDRFTPRGHRRIETGVPRDTQHRGRISVLPPLVSTLFQGPTTNGIPTPKELPKTPIKAGEGKLDEPFIANGTPTTSHQDPDLAAGAGAVDPNATPKQKPLTSRSKIVRPVGTPAAPGTGAGAGPGDGATTSKLTNRVHNQTGVSEIDTASLVHRGNWANPQGKR